MGIHKTKAAIELAYEQELDLVEIAPNGNPPVCKIMDYGKYRFDRDKKEKESRKKQVVVEIKEIRFTCKIGAHDLTTKINHANKFLEGGNKVKISIMFSGREMHHKELGFDLMDTIAQRCSEFGTPEKNPSVDGRFMTMFLAPKTK